MDQTEIDLLADVIWWIKGYRAANSYSAEYGVGCRCDLDATHLEALRKARVELMAATEQAREDAAIAAAHERMRRECPSPDDRKDSIHSTVSAPSAPPMNGKPDEVVRQRHERLAQEMRDEAIDAAMRAQYFIQPGDWQKVRQAVVDALPNDLLNRMQCGEFADTTNEKFILQLVRPFAQGKDNTIVWWWYDDHGCGLLTEGGVPSYATAAGSVWFDKSILPTPVDERHQLTPEQSRALSDYVASIAAKHDPDGTAPAA